VRSHPRLRVEPTFCLEEAEIAPPIREPGKQRLAPPFESRWNSSAIFSTATLLAKVQHIVLVDGSNCSGHDEFVRNGKVHMGNRTNRSKDNPRLVRQLSHLGSIHIGHDNDYILARLAPVVK
jgi:hypothetical protein